MVFGEGSELHPKVSTKAKPSPRICLTVVVAVSCISYYLLQVTAVGERPRAVPTNRIGNPVNMPHLRQLPNTLPLLPAKYSSR